jgi:hypothetical protein
MVDRDPASGFAAEERVVIHLERVILPPGLRAVAYRDGRGNLVIYVSETLDAACQRSAVVEAIRAARRTRWRAALPSAIAVLLGIRAIAARAFGVVKLRPLAWGATATTAVLGATAAGVFVTAVPHHHAPSASGGRAQPSSVRPTTPGAPGTQPAHAGRQGTVEPVAARKSPSSGHAASTGKPSPATSPTGSGSTSAPSPTPAASPEPSPSPSPSLLCVILLGENVCVP